MLIGGVANLFWGVPRSTLDIDLTIRLEEGASASFVSAIKDKFHLRVKDPIAFMDRTKVLPVEDSEGVGVDLILARLPYEFQAIRRAKNVRVCGETIRVCTPEDLILHKIVSDRVRDREDVRGIIRSLGTKIDRKYLDPMVSELAGFLSKKDLVIFYRSCFKKA